MNGLMEECTLDNIIAIKSMVGDALNGLTKIDIREPG